MKLAPVLRVTGTDTTLIPAIVTLILAVLSVVPINIPDYDSVAPDFLLISIYHWTLYRPNDLPYAAIFVIALLEDLLTAGPPGLIELVMLGVRWGMLNARFLFVGRSFPIVWGGFAVTAIGVAVGEWLLGSLLAGSMQDPRSLAFRTVLTVGFYPVMTPVFARLQKLRTG